MKTRAGSDKSRVEFKSAQRKTNAVVSVPPVSVPIVETKSPRRTQTETSPVRRRREISKHQEERMKLITKALDGYNDELSKLFEIATWKELIRKLKRGAPDERKYNSEENAERTARTIIEQIASKDYVNKVGQILSGGSKRGKIEDRSTTFMLLATEFESRQSEGLWMRITGRVDDSSSEQDDPPNILNSSQENPTCVVLELVEGEKENATLNKRQTRNSAKAQQSPLRIKSSQPLEISRNNMLREYGKTKQSFTNGTNFQSTISISKEDFADSKTVIDDSLEVKSSRLCSPNLFSQDDEVIENDTPPPTPINGLDPEPSIPRKRTRFNSNSRDLRERSPSITRHTRTYGRHDMSFRSIEDESPHSSRPNNENGTLTRFGVYDCPSFGFSSSSSTACGKEYEDLPDLEMPDTVRDKDKENLPKSEHEILRDYPRPLSGPELRSHMFEEMEEALSRPKKDKIVTAFGLTLMQEQLAVYNKSEWLEDANIDFYLEMIKSRNNRNGVNNYPKVYIFQSYFYKLLDKRGYESVEGATGKDNIFEYDLVLIPIHSDHHWVLVVVNFNEKTMMCYDSMDHDNEKHLRIIAGYLKREWKERKAKTATQPRELRDFSGMDLNLIDESEEPSEWDYLGEEWDVKNLGAEDIPQQKNGRDCGIFCLQFAEYLSRKQTFDFEQRHTAYFRKRMLYETLKKALLIL